VQFYLHVSRPTAYFVKINWDTAMETKQGRIGLGCVARSSRGSFLAAQSVLKKTNAEPIVAKALLALYATIFGRQLGFRKVIFEGDAQVIVK
jgi:ribonuclease HI